jgi:hypothetical protein
MPSVAANPREAEPTSSVVGNPRPAMTAEARPRNTDTLALSSSHRLLREPEVVHDGLWARMCRGLFGVGKPVVQDWKF